MMKPIGLYPLVDRITWFECLLPLGIQTIQLRIKNLSGILLEEEISKAIQLAKQHKTQCFINDYWSLAIKYQAYGVHLGQEDISVQACREIKNAGLKLGISTHTADEIYTALEFSPDYIAIGPIYPTSTKELKYTPLGLEKLHYWVKTLSIPVVAIGGIAVENFQAVKATGADGIAVVSALTKANDLTKVVDAYNK